jgi:hypothetical protein
LILQVSSSNFVLGISDGFSRKEHVFPDIGPPEHPKMMSSKCFLFVGILQCVLLRYWLSSVDDGLL